MGAYFVEPEELSKVKPTTLLRFTKAEVVKPHQALQAHSSLATATDLYIDWSAESHKP